MRFSDGTGDRVLVLDNGIFGRGFGDFVSLYGGRPELYSTDMRNTIDVEALEKYLEQHHDYKYATVVHGDTPSGMLNDVEQICPLLKKYGILTVTDAVSTCFGEALDVEKAQIDILCGGSQKVVSAPPGLTFVVVSRDARDAIFKQKDSGGFFLRKPFHNFSITMKEKWVSLYDADQR